MTQRIIIWYRNDLRLHDHEPMHRALQEQAQVIPLYCFDERQFGTTAFGFPKTGQYRAQFLLESLRDLKTSLGKLGSDLVVRRGLPEEIIPAIAKQLDVAAVYYQEEVTSEELAVETALEEALSKIGVKLQSFWGVTLYYSDDLPFEMF